MAYVMSSVIRLVDEASPILKNIGNTGARVIAGLEDGFIKVDSAISQAAKCISEFTDLLSAFSGSTSDAAAQSEYFSAVIFDESEELRKNAQSLQLKADKAECAAESERRHYEEIQKEIETEGNASDSLKENAEAILQKAQSLEKSAEAWREESNAAEQAYLASDNNTQSAVQAVQAEEKLADSLSKTAQAENEAAKACINTDTAMDNTAKTATGTASSLSKLSGDTSGVVSQSRLLADAMNDEAEKMRKAAQNAQLKADISERMAEAARNHYNELKKEVETSENVTDAMKESASAALKEAERLEKAAEAARKKADAAEKSADAAQENAHAAEKAAKADEQLYNAANKTASMEQKVAESLNKSEKEAREYSDAASDAADKSEQLGSSGANAGELLQDAFTTIGVATALRKIADGFIECTNASIEFESAITGVYKTVDGTDEQLAQISDDIKAMSLEIPSTTTEIAGVAESAGQLGIATDNITSFTETMINLGEATNLSSDEAASSLAKFANITGMSAENYENLGSSVVALGNNFATTEADIVAMATRMASAGTLAGLTETDILGLAAAMSSVGIEADAGGSAMSTLLSDIQVAVETGSDDLEDFASVANMTSEQFQSAFKDNAANALYAFINGLNDVERNGKTATVILEDMGITEIRLSNAVKSLASNSDGLADALDVSSQAWEENTALAAEANTRCNVKKPLLPHYYITTISNWQKEKLPVRLYITKCDIVWYVSIESFQYSQSGGDVGTYDYSISLKQYKTVKIRQIKISISKNKDKKAETSKKKTSRVNTQKKPKTYTVVSGDCLWNIAKKFYGDGSQYMKIYNANKKIIGSNPNMIKVGQVLTIP